MAVGPQLLKRELYEDPRGNLYIIEWWRHMGLVTKTTRLVA